MFSTATKIRARILLVVVFVPLIFGLPSSSADWRLGTLIEVDCASCLDGAFSTILVMPKDQLHPRWNADGTMLSFVETGPLENATLVVLKVESNGKEITFEEIFRFPTVDREKTMPDDDELPGYRKGVPEALSGVEMIRWATNDPDLLLFQYENRLFYAKPRLRESPQPFRLKPAYREYAKWRGNCRGIVYGENGILFEAGIRNSEGEPVFKRNESRFRDSNPHLLSDGGREGILFERYDENIDCGIYYGTFRSDSPIKIIDLPISTEMLPEPSPGGKMMAFVSNLREGGQGGGPVGAIPSIEYFQRTDWRLYAVNLQDPPGPVPVEGWIDVSGEGPVRLDFRCGLPRICWAGDRALLYMRKGGEEDKLGLFVAEIADGRQTGMPVTTKSVSMRTEVGQSTILRIDDLAYSGKKRLIALSCFRKGNECLPEQKGLKPELCAQFHNRIFIGRLDMDR